MFGGREQATRLDIYNYQNNTWSQGARAPLEFNHFQAVEYDGLVWVIGAFRTNNFPNEAPVENIYIYNPALNIWMQGREIPTNRRRGGAGVVLRNDKFYLLAGNTRGHNGGFVNWFDEYDPINNTWTNLQNAPRARDHFAATIIDNRIYAVSGRLSGGPGGVFAPLVPQVDVFNFNTNTWSTLANSRNLPTPRAGASVVSFGGEVYVIGGEGSNPGPAFKTVEAYNPTSNSWSTKSELNFGRHGTQAIVSGNGIHIAGGSPAQGGGRMHNMEVFDRDAPIGEAITASTLSAAASLSFASGETKNLSVTSSNGNAGNFITNVAISGNNAASFTIVNNLNKHLIKSNTSQSIGISAANTNSGQALLTITYDNGKEVRTTLTIGNGGETPPTGGGTACSSSATISGLSVTASTANSVTIGFNNLSNVNTYEVRTFNAGTFNGQLSGAIKFTSGSGSPITITGLDTASNFTFAIRALCSSNGVTPLANINGATTGGTTPPPTGTACNSSATISGLVATAVSNTSINVSFNNFSGANTYEVRTFAEGTFANSLTGAIDYDSGTASPITVSGLTAGTSYTFAVRAICAGGGTSNLVSVNGSTSGGVTPPPPPTNGGDVFFVINRQTRRKLAPDGNADGARLIQVAANNNTDITKWTRVNTTGNFFYLRNVATGKYFRPANGTEGSALEQRPTSYSGNFTQWEQINTTNGYFYLKNRQTAHYFRPQGNGDNSPMQQRPTTFSGNYTQWKFEAASAKVLNSNIGEIIINNNPVVNGHILLSNADDTDTNFIISSLSGEVLESGKVNYNSIDVSNFSAGMYIVQFVAGNKTQVEKIVITN